MCIIRRGCGACRRTAGAAGALPGTASAGAAAGRAELVSRARGNVLQNALARYLTAWWPHAESAGAGRNGSDVLGTPGVVWECKTAYDFKRDFRPAAWIKQSEAHAAELRPLVRYGPKILPPRSVVVYFPPGIGEANTGNALAIVPLHVQVQLLREAGYC